jgi:hypothetical protein
MRGRGGGRREKGGKPDGSLLGYASSFLSRLYGFSINEKAHSTYRSSKIHHLAEDYSWVKPGSARLLVFLMVRGDDGSRARII